MMLQFHAKIFTFFKLNKGGRSEHHAGEIWEVGPPLQILKKKDF
jgi:hypothetical protein